MIGDRVEIIAVPATRGVNPFAIDTYVCRTVVDMVENDYRYELEKMSAGEYDNASTRRTVRVPADHVGTGG